MDRKNQSISLFIIRRWYNKWELVCAILKGKYMQWHNEGYLKQQKQRKKKRDVSKLKMKQEKYFEKYHIGINYLTTWCRS